MFYNFGIRGGSVDIHYREDAAEFGGRALSYPFHAVKSARFGQAAFLPAKDVALPTALFQDWKGPVIQPDGTQVFVPRQGAPISRSVAGFAIAPNGIFTKVDDAPTDGPVEFAGRWTPTESGIRAELEDGRVILLDIVSVDDRELRARANRST